MGRRQKNAARKHMRDDYQKKLDAFVARTGCALVEEDKFTRQLDVTNHFRQQDKIRHAFANGAKPWR